MKLIFPILLASTIFLHAQADTAHHRKIYAEINDQQSRYAKSQANLEEDGVTIRIKGFSQNGTLRKIET